jgi:hypothetical protein
LSSFRATALGRGGEKETSAGEGSDWRQRVRHVSDFPRGLSDVAASVDASVISCQRTFTPDYTFLAHTLLFPVYNNGGLFPRIATILYSKWPYSPTLTLRDRSQAVPPLSRHLLPRFGKLSGFKLRDKGLRVHS